MQNKNDYLIFFWLFFSLLIIFFTKVPQILIKYSQFELNERNN